MIIQAISALDIEPKAMLFSHTAESLAIAGVLFGRYLGEQTNYHCRRLGEDFLGTVKNGDKVEIADGTVKIQN